MLCEKVPHTIRSRLFAVSSPARLIFVLHADSASSVPSVLRVSCPDHACDPEAGWQALLLFQTRIHRGSFLVATDFSLVFQQNSYFDSMISRKLREYSGKILLANSFPVPFRQPSHLGWTCTGAPSCPLFH